MVFEVHGDLGPVIGAGDDAHDSGVLGGGGLIGAFGEGQNLEGAEGAVLSEDVGSGFINGADDIDGVGFRDGDNVVGLDEDVLRGIGRVHHALNLDRGDGELAGGIVGGAGEGNGSPFEAAGDIDDVAGFRAKAAGKREDLEEIFLALELMHAWGLDLAEDGDRLAAHFGEVNRDIGFDQIFLKASGDGGFELLSGEAAGLNAARLKAD